MFFSLIPYLYRLPSNSFPKRGSLKIWRKIRKTLLPAPQAVIIRPIAKKMQVRSIWKKAYPKDSVFICSFCGIAFSSLLNAVSMTIRIPQYTPQSR